MFATLFIEYQVALLPRQVAPTTQLVVKKHAKDE